MSEAEWVTATIGLIGVIIGAGITYFWNWREHREKYRVMTFEKRLQAHQQAYYWCQKLNEVLNTGSSQDKHKTAREAREWWNGNCLFLDAKSRSNLLSLTNLSHAYANNMLKAGELWRGLDETCKAIVAGIGAEYLSEMLEKPNELKKEM